VRRRNVAQRADGESVLIGDGYKLRDSVSQFADLAIMRFDRLHNTIRSSIVTSFILRHFKDLLCLIGRWRLQATRSKRAGAAWLKSQRFRRPEKRGDRVFNFLTHSIQTR
jgi:hypothetical protein